MKDIAILEQQQRDAQRKLESAQTTKENKLNQQRQLNTLLEKKKYSNGALRAKLQQCRDFLSGATRDLGSCKLGTDRFQREIGEFNDKLNKGIRSAKMIEVCNAKIDSLINLTEHKVSKISRLKRDRMDKTKKARMKYEQTEKEDRMLRSAIQDVHKKAREWAEEKASLRGEISKLDSDKMSAQNTEQSTELRVQSACDQIKSEEDRTFQVKDTQLTEIDETVKQKEIIRTEIDSMSDSIHTLKLDLQAQKEKIIECQKVEEGHPISTTSIDDEDYVPVFDQNFFRMDLTKLEAVAKKEDDELNSLTSSIEEMERTLQESKKETLKNEEETTMLDSSAKSMSEEEENRRGETEEFQTILETTRTEVAKLKDSFREMEEIREAGVQTHYKAMADCDAEISKYTELIEDLKLKTKGEDTTLKTRIRLFEEEEKPKLLAALKAAEKGSRRAEKKHKDLIDMSTEASIESKLQAEYEFEKKFNDEKMKWEAKVRNIVVKRDTILEGKFSMTIVKLAVKKCFNFRLFD
jgi:chromosome segregation ATPase